MTVNTISSIAEFDTNGVTTNYPFYFKFLVNEDLVVTYVDPAGVSSILTLGTQYTVHGAGNDEGGEVVTAMVLAGPGKLVVSREMDAYQQTSLRNQGKFLAEIHEDAFDKLTMLIQQGLTTFTRALTRPFGRDYFFAEGRRIASVKDPVEDQDAATKKSVETYVSGILETGQGPVNNSANVLYVDPYSVPHIVQDMSGPNGGRLIGHRGRDLGRKAEEVISIQDFAGAVDDFNGTTGTNCYAALQAIFAAYPGGARVRFPKTSTGRYLINGGQFATLAGFVWDPDPGVTIHQVGLPSPMIASGVKSTRQLPIRLADQGFTFYLGPRAYSNIVEKSGFMSLADGEAPELVNVNMNLTNNNRISWPDGPVTPVTPATVSPDAIVWQPVSNSAFVLTSKPVRPGSEITAYMSVPTFGGILIAGVITDAGFSIVRQDASGGQIQTAVKSGTNPIVESLGISNFMTGRDSYRFSLGLMSVRIHSYRSYSVLINGVELIRVRDAGGVILQAGFGGGFASNTESLSIAGMSIAQKVRVMGKQPLRIVVLGDSTGDPAVPCAYTDYMRQYISGIGGAQIVELRNLAVSGETSSQQLTRFLAEDISGFDYCIPLIGVNDIQLSQAPSVLTANIGQIIDKCNANRVIPIVGIPTMFYGSADAALYGNIGQATTNSTGGSPTRATLLRFLATRGVTVFRTLEHMGGIFPQLLGYPDNAPVVMDNVHPDDYGRMLMGYGAARAIIADMQPLPEKTIPARAVPAAWIVSPQGATQVPQYAVQADMFSMIGVISVITDPLPNTATIINLPEMFCPATELMFSVPIAPSSGVPSGNAFVIVKPTGVVQVYGVSNGTRFIYLSSVRYPIAG
ncbi:hypothetical protein [Pseudomonas sp. Au-Pse12]|uniref:hypothetical protein n=1 Tax=Pseudomonas sp. Au-Pse12 TaxID=2906459 RepID=UPI001E4C68EE|nr:hypothetical protein [Pseudomonas sp. Au-Pse12]MCE4056291.1 hypothetical protein [Pseudomonas sp. Au-Pse12]